MSEPQAPKWAIQRAVLARKIPAPAKLVMLVLLDKSNGPAELGKFSPTTRELAEQTGLDRHTVIAYMKPGGYLEQHGWLTASRKSGSKPWYTLAAGEPFRVRESRQPAGAEETRATSGAEERTTPTGAEERTTPTEGGAGGRTTSGAEERTTTGAGGRTTTGADGRTTYSPLTNSPVHRAAPADACSAAHHFELSDNEAGVSKLPGSKISFDGPAPWDEPSPATTIGELRRLVAGHVPPEAAGTPAPEPARLAEASRQQAAEIESFLAGPPPAPSSSYSSSTAAPAPELAPLPPGPSANPDCPDCARRGSECAYHRDVRELEEALSAAETSGPEDDEYAGLMAL